MHLFISVILLLILFYYFLFIWKIKKYQVFNKIPGPNWIDVFKLFTTSSNEDIFKTMINLPEKYGPVTKIWMKPFAPILLVADPKYFENILGSREHLQKTKFYDILYTFIGNGLTSNKNVIQWKSDRKLFNPVFKRTTMSNYSTRLKYHMDNLKTTLYSFENKPIDAYLIIHQCTVHMVLEYLIEESMDDDIALKVINSLEACLSTVLERAYSSYKSNDLIFRFTKNYKFWVENCEILEKIFMDILKRQIQMRKDKVMNGEKKNLMDLLLNNDFSQFNILSHTKTFILAGLHTVAVTAAFTLFEIAKHKHIQEQLLKEYLSFAGNNKDYIPSFDDYQNMTYTEAVIKEAMRMYPSVPFIERKLSSPVTINELTFPKDTNVIFSIYSLHQLNFPYADKFDPDRFLSKNLNNINQYAYAPFSIGQRDCIGRRIAMIQLKFIISYIIKNFSLDSVYPEHKMELIGQFTLKSKNGLPVIFKKRT